MYCKMKNILLLTLILVFVGSLSVLAAADVKKGDKKTKNISKVSTNDVRAHIAINDFDYWYNTNGKGASDPNAGDYTGAYFPKGTPNSAIFADGFVWTGNFNIPSGTVLRSGGGTYVGGLQAGKILTDGSVAGGNYTPAAADDPALAKYKVYKVRKDWKSMAPGAERDAYESDYKNWPWQDGAPLMENAAGGDSVDADGYKVPQFLGDETQWFVSNDMDAGRSRALYGRDPMGIEIQVTTFAFKQAPFNTMIFMKRKFINKSGVPITDMYVSQWSDPDLGGASDDLVGVDKDLKLGYVYNGYANDATYGTNVPAVGYVFFQGPLVPGDPTDVGTSFGKTFPGKKNLPLSSFSFYINGGPANLSDPALGNAAGTEQLNYYQTGRDYYGVPFPTPFPYSGDPVRGKGDLDGKKYAPDDRRLMLSSGPFTMAPGDTQEIVTATIVGLGANNLLSVGVLKSLASEAQSAYSLNFEVPTTPATPVVKATALSERVVLDWSNPSDYQATESHQDGAYQFEGYMIYQMPSATETDVTKGYNIEAFDVDNGISIIKAKVFNPATGTFVVQPAREFGNSGIKRFISLDYDYLNNRPLINNREYYYIVTAVSAYHPSDDAAIGLGVASYVESRTANITVIPQANPGQRVGDKAEGSPVLTHTGNSDGQVAIKIINPKDVIAGDYEVRAKEDTDAASPTFGETLWNITNTTTGNDMFTSYRTLLSDISKAGYEDIVNGLQVGVSGPPLGIKSLSYTGGTRWVTGVNWGGAEFFGGMDLGENFLGSTITPTQYVNVRLEFAGPGSSPGGVGADRWTKGYAYSGATFRGKGYIPIAAYDTETGRRLNICYRKPATDPDLRWDMGWDDATQTFIGANGASEYVFIMNTTYDSTANAYSNTAGNKYNSDNLYAFWGQKRSTFKYLEAKFEMIILANHVIADGEKWSFTLNGAPSNDTFAKEDVNLINVFPNPYFGANSLEKSRFNRMVTFTHLPATATLRIFTLSGTHVRTIKHDNGTQYDTWDLLNEGHLPVASGVYVVYVDTPYGSKVLKLSIIQETQYLENI